MKANRSTFFGVLFVALLCISCKGDKESKEVEEEKVAIEAEKPKDQVAEYYTESMEFIGPDSLSSGWTTFKYTNKSFETHLFLLDKYPEGKTIADTKKDIFPPFDKGMDLINEGKVEEGYAAFGALPEWFQKVVYTGGAGLISPNQTTELTIKLEPGYYIMECYVKMSNGKFHTSMGMVKPIIVTNEVSNHLPPIPTVNIAISSTEGIVFDDAIKAGENTFKVSFVDQKKHEHFLEHDVNLVKLDDTADLTALEAWMDWSNPKGLINPGPAGVTFLGGMQEMPAGSEGYFKATLTKGKYAFISEVPKASDKNMLKVFEVTD
ncbi:hypothetical protein [Mangrovimonas sp. YM274]|uniref:hypothetical protein n=1 Tax=Mangrovimonas sp. YM274 TaxID=3070660 RepID=UPI0027DB6171|nr:hypothetical protein [Mangrovimonas sp. YM274]WMI70193.1 hypothetical protein RBH95_07540 [Mangrovimonas sp. YM274]